PIRIGVVRVGGEHIEFLPVVESIAIRVRIQRICAVKVAVILLQVRETIIIRISVADIYTHRKSVNSLPPNWQSINVKDNAIFGRARIEVTSDLTWRQDARIDTNFSHRHGTRETTRVSVA